MRGELEQDIHIHDAAVLPNFVNLPQVTAAEYGRVRAICNNAQCTSFCGASA